MVYKVIGLMSGSSLDGLDIVYTHLDELRGVWKYELLNVACLPYSKEWMETLSNAKNLSAKDFALLHTRYGKYLAEQVNNFIDTHSLHHKIDFIASHGHTVFHEPKDNTTIQIGCGATLAALTQLPVISDLRAMDVALGGQGAPIVPIGDSLLFADHDYCLNIGGIVNISIKKPEGIVAFDVCTGNQALNILAQREGKEMDENGMMARNGQLLTEVYNELNGQDYFSKPAPKSLSNDVAIELASPLFSNKEYHTKDLLHTMVMHIATQVRKALESMHSNPSKMLVTGGGAFNSFLVEAITEQLKPLGIEVILPDEMVINYKEALVMALIGTLRWREETNVLASVTGASQNSVGGALWMGQR